MADRCGPVSRGAQDFLHADSKQRCTACTALHSLNFSEYKQEQTMALTSHGRPRNVFFWYGIAKIHDSTSNLACSECARATEQRCTACLRPPSLEREVFTRYRS